MIALWLGTALLARPGTAQTPPPGAADEYDRLGALFYEIEQGDEGLWASEGGDAALTQFTETGAIDAHMRRWLERARPNIDAILRASAMPYARELDRSQGFSLLLPHLSRQRMLARALGVLVLDASRNDRARFGDLLRAQARVGSRTADDGLLVSSLVSLSISDFTRARLVGMVDRGELDADFAADALSAADILGGRSGLRLGEALGFEREALEGELAKLAELDGDARKARLETFFAGRADAADTAFTDEAIAAAPSQIEAFFDAATAANAAPTRDAAAAAVRALEAEVAAGAYGDLVRLLAPAIGRVIDSSWKQEIAWNELRETLHALADGRLTPEDCANAAPHYRRAAAAAMKLGVGAQSEIDAIRVASRELPDELRSAGRMTLARLEPSITAELLAGSRLGRLRLENAMGMRRIEPFGDGFVGETLPGVAGAVRAMLAAALVEDAHATAPLPKPVAPAPELAVAAVRVAGHYATLGSFGHSLAARAMLRDAAAAIEELVARGRFDDEARAALEASLAKLDAGDPLGMGRAVAREREALATRRIETTGGGGLALLAEAERLARLAPREVAFLAGAASGANPALEQADCGCPLHGALLDMRDWFDTGALVRIDESRVRLAERAARATAEAEDGDELPVLRGSPLEGLDVMPPFDPDAVAAEGVALVERLRRSCAPAK